MRRLTSGLRLTVAIRNRRNLLYLDNFVDAIRVCIEQPAAAGQTPLLGDGKLVSTPDLVRALASAMGQPTHLLNVPVGGLERIGIIFGRCAKIAALSGSAWINSSLIRPRLTWMPPDSMQEELQRIFLNTNLQKQP